jgi:hypothetical protein
MVDGLEAAVPMALSQEARSERGKIAALTRHARADAGADPTKEARAAIIARYEQQIDPHGLLTPEERRVRACRAIGADLSRARLARLREQEQSRTADLVDDLLAEVAK